jgi:iron complex outermembrane receptor protein
MKTRVLLSISFCILISMTYSQMVLTGVVTSQDGIPIPYAKLKVNNNQKTVVSNSIGEFVIKKLYPMNANLLVKASGYAPQEIDLSNVDLSRTLRIEMFKQVQTLEAVQVEATRTESAQTSKLLSVGLDPIKRRDFGQDMPVLLDILPSVVTTSDAGAGVGYTGIRIRGADASRINVTINGIPVNDPESHDVYWVNMPDLAGSVESIYVQNGLGSSTNGAGAFGANINIKTADIANKAYGTIDNSIGSFNTWKSSVRAGTGLIDNKFTMEMRLSRILSDGYIDRASSNLKSFYLSGSYSGNNSLLKAIIFSGKERTYQSWYGTPESRVNGDIDAMNAYADRNYLSADDRENLINSGRTYNFYTYQNEVDNYQQDNYQLHYTKRFRFPLIVNVAGHYTKGRGYYEQFREEDVLSDYELSNVVLGSDTVTTSDLIRRRWLDNDFVGGVYSLKYNYRDFRFILGGSANSYIGRHFGELVWARFASQSNIYDKYYDNNARKSEVNTYLKVKFDKGNFLINGDMQYRHVAYNFVGIDEVSGEIIDLEQDVLYDFFNPKMTLGYYIDDTQLLSASFGIGHREPVRKDFRESTVNNRPSAEILRDLELGYLIGNRKFDFKATAYYMNYKDQLILTGEINDVGGYTRTNVDDSYRLGLELQGSYKLQRNLKLSAALTLSENKIPLFTEFIDNYDDPNVAQTQNLYENTDLAFSPNIIGNVGILYLLGQHFTIDWMTKYVGDQFLDNTSNQNRKIDAFTYSNFAIYYSLENKVCKEISLGLQCNNLFNTSYESNGYTWGYISGGERISENFYYPQAGRNFMIRLLVNI